jgi:predicted ATP-dependent Lon-type protease
MRQALFINIQNAIQKKFKKTFSTTYLAPFINELAKHSLCSLVRKYFFLTNDLIAIFAHYFQ